MKRSRSNDSISEIDNNNKKTKVVDSVAEECSLYIFYYNEGRTPNMYLVPNIQITEQIQNWSANALNISRNDDEDELDEDHLFGYNYILSLTCAEYLSEDGSFNKKCKKAIIKCNGHKFAPEQIKLLSDDIGKWLKYKSPITPVHIKSGTVYIYDCSY